MDAWERFQKKRQGCQRDREGEEETMSAHGQPGDRMNLQESQQPC